MSAFSCSKSSNSTDEGSNLLVGTYKLEKTGTNYYENGKIVKRDISTEKINGEMTLLTDKSFRIVFTSDGESEVVVGTYDSENKIFTVQQDGEFVKTSYFLRIIS
ncbi:hypothetical protein [Sphingobacterium sp. IITKGP-BTPF85]|uniref:hypothetical protein n=1 Tax=Sphingobacterium sp. IITKGP-BTPF85 TaxID=1338009 RepID=UPI00038A268F|nr:hypothetical protein [Sphingobacterium sp. IITKGP-BTPF85]KKX50402.1 hypothetical protein L950_0210740 [Sphingobacterium sp. IITKGP-BTPF85]